MKEWFKSQLMAVVHNQGELIAYMTEDQIELMFDIGRSLGFKSEIACVQISSRTIVQRASHETWDDFYLYITIKPVKGINSVHVKYWDKGDPEFIEYVYQLQLMDER